VRINMTLTSIIITVAAYFDKSQLQPHLQSRVYKMSPQTMALKV